MNDTFDTQLARALQADAEPADEGFSRRVMAALPPQTPARQPRWLEWVHHAHWAAISGAACTVATAIPWASAPLDTPQQMAGLTLLALLGFWSVPSRFSRP